MPYEDRPQLVADMDPSEFRRWYWLHSELIDFARRLGVRTSGSKSALQERIAGFLAGEATEASTGRSTHAAAQLVGPLGAETVIPPGQRCSQVVREWFVEHAGPSFRFSAVLRNFFATADGTTTLGDALVAWRDDVGERPIDEQFEYNRFTRRWWAEHAEGSRHDLLDDWRSYRATPTDRRDRA